MAVFIGVLAFVGNYLGSNVTTTIDTAKDLTHEVKAVKEDIKKNCDEITKISNNNRRLERGMIRIEVILKRLDSSIRDIPILSSNDPEVRGVPTDRVAATHSRK